jgi:hypothetical protein
LKDRACRHRSLMPAARTPDIAFDPVRPGQSPGYATWLRRLFLRLPRPEE